MTYPTVVVNGVSVRVDADGRYNLNDLHVAAVARGEASESQRPSNFIKSATIKRCAHELSEATKVASVKIIKGGLESGIWGLELVAIRYAASIFSSRYLSAPWCTSAQHATNGNKHMLCLVWSRIIFTRWLAAFDGLKTLRRASNSFSSGFSLGSCTFWLMSAPMQPSGSARHAGWRSPAMATTRRTATCWTSFSGLPKGML